MSFLRRHRPVRAVKPASPFRPRLEELEDRCVPSTLTVSNTLDTGSAGDGSLRGEIAAASGGDQIVFAGSLAGKTITLTAAKGPLDINTNLTIDGAGSGITVNGGGTRVFQIDAGNTVAINGLTIAGGHTGGFGSGGGIFNVGSLTLRNSTVTGNSAFEGGGIFNGSGATMIMSGDTVTNNTSSGDNGGGIDNLGQLTILNCTIAANQAVDGGGIANGGVLRMANSTVASNTVVGPGAEGGGIATVGAELDLLNTIVFNPNSGAATQNDVNGQITRAQGNLFGSTVSIHGGGNLGGNQFNVNPLLGPLQNNGGPTATMALLPGSPAIGAGVSTSAIPGLAVPATDQRGDPRPANGIDVGAFQTQPPPAPAPAPVAEGVVAALVRVGKRRRLLVVVRYADSGAVKTMFWSAFQKPPFKAVGVVTVDSNGDGVADAVLLLGWRHRKFRTLLVPV